jgi:Tfp pilus assembly protein PilF
MKREFAQAHVDYTRAIEKEPKNFWAYYERAVANYNMGHYLRAAADLFRSMLLRINK